jgi:hypothetical protein
MNASSIKSRTFRPNIRMDTVVPALRHIVPAAPGGCRIPLRKRAS